MTVIGLYEPGSSVLHRISVGWKALGLLIVITAIVLADHPWQLGVAAVVLAAGFALGRIRPAVAWAQLWPMRWIVLLVAIFQILFAGLQPAIMLCGTLVLSVAAAALVTLTTRVSEMLDALQRLLRPLRRVGVDPDRIALVLALTIRCIPLLALVMRNVSEARKARGLGFSIRALAAPVLVRALRTADEMGDALVARGVDD
jgi:biotin transport system permease protein